MTTKYRKEYLQIKLDDEEQLEAASTCFSESKSFDEFVEKYLNEIHKMRRSPKNSTTIKHSYAAGLTAISVFIVNVYFVAPYFDDIFKERHIISQCEKPVQPSVIGGMTTSIVAKDVENYQAYVPKLISYQNCERTFQITLNPLDLWIYRPLLSALKMFLCFGLPFSTWSLVLHFANSVRTIKYRRGSLFLGNLSLFVLGALMNIPQTFYNDGISLILLIIAFVNWYYFVKTPYNRSAGEGILIPNSKNDT